MHKIDGKGIHGMERLLRGMAGKALEVDRERKCLWMDSEAGGTQVHISGETGTDV